MKLSRLLSIGFAALAVFTYPAPGAPSDLDLTFGGTGKVTTDFGGNGSEGYAVALQDDGKILVAGYSFNGSNNDFALVRYNGDGSLDTTFNGTGKVITALGVLDDVGTSVAVQDDGKVVVAGISGNGANNDFAVVRYNVDGSLDTTFGGNGKVTTDTNDEFAQSVAIQSDGKIVLAGSSNSSGNYDFAVVRYNTNGSLDMSFNGTGKVTTDIGGGRDDGFSVAVQNDGKIVIAGISFNGSNNDIAVVRYNTNGSLDTSFAGAGKVTTSVGSGNDEGYKVAIQSDGKIVVSGSCGNGSNRDFALVRYNIDGSLDTTFGGTGKVITDIGGAKNGGCEWLCRTMGKS